MRRNAADRAPIAIGEEKLRFAMFEPRVLVGIEQGGNLALERRHPIGIAAIEAIGELDEHAAIRPVHNRADLRPGQMIGHATLH